MAKENRGWEGAMQPKERNNCGGHRFTSGSVVFFWPGGGPTPPLAIKGVSRLTGIFQRPAERKTLAGALNCFSLFAHRGLHFMPI